MCILGPPVLIKGPSVPIPYGFSIGRDFSRVRIGAPAYVRTGNQLFIDCIIRGGTPPLSYKWFRNGSPFHFQVPHSIVLDNPRNGDVFNCTVSNHLGFDSAITTINVGGKWIMNICMHAYILCMYICSFTLHIQ